MSDYTLIPWGKIPGFNNLDYSDESDIFYIRIDRGKTLDGWWAIDELVTEATDAHGFRRVGLSNGCWSYAKLDSLADVKATLRKAGVMHRIELSIPNGSI
ncbi:hypothetical protein [Glutamicibacter sp. TV12E]|uniref:hypothetical protein n=1 Tax=Glutamicibacter sp. TV12E TaxID=3446362 RepID=UPI00403349E6